MVYIVTKWTERSVISVLSLRLQQPVVFTTYGVLLSEWDRKNRRICSCKMHLFRRWRTDFFFNLSSYKEQRSFNVYCSWRDWWTGYGIVLPAVFLRPSYSVFFNTTPCSIKSLLLLLLLSSSSSSSLLLLLLLWSRFFETKRGRKSLNRCCSVHSARERRGTENLHFRSIAGLFWW